LKTVAKVYRFAQQKEKKMLPVFQNGVQKVDGELKLVILNRKPIEAPLKDELSISSCGVFTDSDSPDLKD
jgi:hypothetical protein